MTTQETGTKSPPPNATATQPSVLVRALRFITLVGVLVALFLGVTLWWQQARVDGSIDVEAIDAAIAKIEGERNSQAPVGSIEALSSAIDVAWAGFQDREGKHYYVDSATNPDTIGVPPPAVRKKHLAPAELLRESTIRLAPRAAAVTTPSASDHPRAAEERVAERALPLLKALRNMAGNAIRRNEQVIAVDYSECGLLLVTALSPTTNLELLAHYQREAERFTEYGKTAAQRFGDWNDLQRMIERIDAFLEAQTTFVGALDVEILAWAAEAESEDGSAWQRAKRRKVAYEELDQLLRVRELALDPKQDGAAILEIDNGLGLRFQHYRECQKSIAESRGILEVARGTSD